MKYPKEVDVDFLLTHMCWMSWQAQNKKNEESLCGVISRQSFFILCLLRNPPGCMTCRKPLLQTLFLPHSNHSHHATHGLVACLQRVAFHPHHVGFVQIRFHGDASQDGL